MKNKKKQLLEINRDKKIIFSVLLIVIFGIFILVEAFNKGTYSTSAESTDTITITCPETAVLGDEVECVISANLVTMSVQGINAKYNVSSGMEFVEFSTDSWDIYSNDQDGFVLVNLEGVTGEVVIGKVKYTISTAAVANDVYEIGLVDITIGDGEENTVSLENTSDSVRILSDISTLDNITLSVGKLNETFNKNNYNYTATVDSNTVTVGVVKTDENSTIAGDIEVVNLHYGTNELKIMVTSEDGKNTNTYVISVYVPYTLSTDVYTYNEDENYIYTGTDTDGQTILTNIAVPSGLDKKIDNNKLIISYGTEVLLDTVLVNISSEDYDLTQNYIYVGTDEFNLDKITVSNGNTVISNDKLVIIYNDYVLQEFAIVKISSSIYDLTKDNIYVETNEIDLSKITVTSGSAGITDNKLVIMYGGKILDTYNILLYSLSFEENIVVDNTNKYIKHLEEGTTVAGLIDDVSLIGGRIVVYEDDSYKLEKNSADIIKTGNVLVVYVENVIKAEYALSVSGDANGDGEVDLIDLVQIRKHIVGWINPNTNIVQKKTGVYYEAIDMNRDGMVDLIDLVRMRKTIVGLK